jgi:hypothetical protein
MKYSTLGAAICFVILLATACKKENEQPELNLVGLWRGNIYTYGTLLVNKENGKCRMYFSTSYEDTAQASKIWDGNYVKTSRGYEFRFYSDTVVTCVLHTEEVSPQRITGKAFVLQAALDFELQKY